MPRFAISKYSPLQDTSPGQRTVDPGAVVLEVKTRKDGSRGCPCGCGELPKGKSAVFAMGHDARLRGKLIRAHLTGTDIREVVDGTPGDRIPAFVVAERHNWNEYLDAAVLRREGKNRQVLKSAMGSKRLVKVGRWSYTGQVVAVYSATDGGEDAYDVEYVTRTGEIKKARVEASAAEGVAA